jgi:hypothetical protein
MLPIPISTEERARRPAALLERAISRVPGRNRRAASPLQLKRRHFRELRVLYPAKDRELHSEDVAQVARLAGHRFEFKVGFQKHAEPGVTLGGPEAALIFDLEGHPLLPCRFRAERAPFLISLRLAWSRALAGGAWHRPCYEMTLMNASSKAHMRHAMAQQILKRGELTWELKRILKHGFPAPRRAACSC